MQVDILIIGAGASGLMAAYAAGLHAKEQNKNLKIVVLEKMPRPGRKIMITGKGRCNLTNLKDWEAFSPSIRSNQQFVKSAFMNFPPKALVALMNKNGLDTVLERGDRVYPATYRASSVVDKLVQLITNVGVELYCNCEVNDIEVDDAREYPYTIITKQNSSLSARKLIIATGGLSYPVTGSTGDGYRWAEFLGHSVKPCFPSLTAMVPKGYKESDKKGHIERTTPLTILGKSLYNSKLKNIKASLYIDKHLIQEEFGELFFTDGGIEGPVGFNLSRNCVNAMLNGNKASLDIDLKPGIELKVLEKQVQNLWENISKDPRSKSINKNQQLKVLLSKLMPWEICDAFLEMADAKLNNIAPMLKNWHFEIQGYVGFERCVITAGGIKCSEIVGKSMQSKLHKGLFFCGEVLDIDCNTGGYNITIAFCTGYLAGKNAAL